MRRSIRAVARLGTAAAMLVCAMTSARADTITYTPAAFPALTGTLTSLGFGAAPTSAFAETYVVPGLTGTTTRLDFSFVQDLGGYQFSFGFFDRSAVTANAATDRAGWALQALQAATLVFDNRGLVPGATASFEVAAGMNLGLFLVPDDTLAAVLSNPSAFFGGPRPSPLFSVSSANPGGYDHFMSFETGGLFALAFEDLTRTGWSDLDFNDLVVTMRATTATVSRQIETIDEPAGAWLLLGALPLILAARRRRAH